MDFHVCLGCGRDTRNRSQICNTCLYADRRCRVKKEQALRKKNSFQTHDDLLIRNDDDTIFDEPTVKVSDYNGATSRDDI